MPVAHEPDDFAVRRALAVSHAASSGTIAHMVNLYLPIIGKKGL
jgi:hypothetical protein